MTFELFKIIVFFGTAYYANRWMARNKCSKTLIFLFIFIFSRILFSSFHQFTFVGVIGSLSINALHSISMAVIAVFFLDFKLLSLKCFYLIKLVIILMVISAVFNQSISQSVTSIVKWILLLELLVIFLYCFLVDGPRQVTQLLLFAFSYPIILQLLSIIIGYSKANELDGSASYIGGFHHEAVFSVLLYSCLFIGLMGLRYLKVKFKTQGAYLIGFFIFILIMANYRTTLVAVLPFILMFIYDQYWKGNDTKKIVLSFVFSIFLISLFFIEIDVLLDRFIEIPQVIANATDLITEPENYTRQERRYLSGRLYFWSSYISLANEGDWVHLLIGNGMDSWKNHFLKYAHNTFVSFYYELGFLGLTLLFLIFFQMFKQVVLLKERKVKYIFMGMIISFFILNLGTMPLWQIEGIFIFSYIFSFIYYFSIKERVKG